MARLSRREFLEGVMVSSATIAHARELSLETLSLQKKTATEPDSRRPIDFRYAPRLSQAAICFPDDPHKSLVGQLGDLRYGFAKGLQAGMEDFATVCKFSLAGMQDDHVSRQWLEAPHIPVVHTLVERPKATLEVIAFATRHSNEGRVDNVLLSIRASEDVVAVVPRVHICTCAALKYTSGPLAIVVTDATTNNPFLVATKVGSTPDFATWWEEQGYTLLLPHREASRDKSAQYFIRFPQEGQPVDAIQDALQHPGMVLEEAREFWKEWKAFGTTSWSLPGKPGEFLSACARNIQQAREVKDGRLVFQVGPTVYRNLWIVDGNFLLEAARYLGYDKEADDGLLAEWAKQLPSGQVVAGGGGEHWKDTAIAMFTLVRQCELKQDWQFFKDLEPNVRHAINFLVQLRDAAQAGNSTNGRYGLLAPGFADGGMGGVRSEFTNTLWALAGLKAVAEASEHLQIDSLLIAREFYDELRASLMAAAKKEMVRHPNGFEYLPMLAHDDPAWSEPEPWNRPRPQTAQWALSHAIFPGLVFQKNDPIVQGHIALMQCCTREDIPTETGWLWHESVWTYNASFAAHVYLWADSPEWADRTFRGFLNHSSPLYCWREEQPLQQALLGQDWGDMPHNWASAECVRYLRHRMLLEDGPCLRLLEEVEADLQERESSRLENSPTRFGRVTLQMDPTDSHGWKLKFSLEPVRQPASVVLPLTVGGRQLARIDGASFRPQGRKVAIDPSTRGWTAFWR